MTSEPTSATDAPPQAWRDRSWTSFDGLNLHYRDYDGSTDRPPLLCLHGLTRNSRDFEDFADRYAGRFRVIAVDFRGRGRSDHDPDATHYVPLTYAGDLLKLLGENGIDSAIFVGTSLGGLVTMLVAAMQPQRIAGAILNDIGPDVDRPGIDRIRTYVGKGVRFRDWDEAGAYVASINNNLPVTFTAEDWVRFARRLCRQEGDAVVFDYDPAIVEAFDQPEPAEPFDMWPLFRTLAQKPLLVVRGEKSDLLSAATAEAMRGTSDDVDLVTVPGVGHAPTLDEPEAAAAIDRFLQRWD